MFEWLEGTAVAIWVGESLWGYPFMLGCHVVGLAIVVGIFSMRDLRLLGCFEGISYASFDGLKKLGWTGFIINAISGCFLFTSQATTFAVNKPFLIKIAAIFLAAIIGAIIQNRMRDEMSAWDGGGAAVGSVKSLAGVSLALWIVAIIAGRMTAYL